jgi:hypothetical protein
MSYKLYLDIADADLDNHKNIIEQILFDSCNGKIIFLEEVQRDILLDTITAKFDTIDALFTEGKLYNNLKEYLGSKLVKFFLDDITDTEGE